MVKAKEGAKMMTIVREVLSMENNDKVKAFYEDYKEDEREGRESLEFLRSKDIISRYLAKPDMEIADVGGATGAYSFWLAEMGHRVHLLDLAPNHIEIAKQKGQGKGLALSSYSCADARELPYEDQSMDMVLLMGALYHLQSPEARARCLSETFRILKPGGLILCTIMNRFALVIASQKYKLFDSYSREYIENSFKTGIHDKASFYAHTPDEIISEMTSAQFESIQLIAVEGIGNALTNNQVPEDKREAARLLWCIELTETVPELLGASRNIIAVGRKGE